MTVQREPEQCRHHINVAYRIDKVKFEKNMQEEGKISPTCLILIALFPLQIYNRVSNVSSSGVLNPEAKPPSMGIMQGLKYDRNLSDS